MQNNVMRLPHMDIAKAIGIILIVIGHSFPEESTSTIRSFVYLFHVPMFFIISGYFFNEKYIENPKELIFRRIKSLWLPFFYWSSIFIVMHNIFYSLNIYNDEMGFRGHGVSQYFLADFVKKFFNLFLFKCSEQLLGAFWFLSCLFFSVVIFLFYLMFSKKLNIKYSLLTISFLGFVVGNLMFFYKLRVPFIPYDLRLFAITSFLYFLGYCYKKHEKHIPITFWLASISLIVLVFLNRLDLMKINSIHSIVGYLPKSIFFLIITPILGTYLVMYTSKFILKFDFSSFFEFVGKNTITILALHFLCFKIINYYIVAKQNLSISHIAYFPVIPNNESFFILYSFSGIIIPIALQLLFNRLKFKINTLIKRNTAQ